jgi:hypothetical protein
VRRRVFLISAEYSANPRDLPPERRGRPFLGEPHGPLQEAELVRLFFRFPNKSEDGRTRPEDWKRDFGLESKVSLNDLFASAAHRALTSLHALCGGEYPAVRDAITDLFVTSMPGLDPDERMNIGLVPQSLRGLLSLSPRVHAQFVVGTSDSGAWAFAQAVRAARNAERPATIVVIAGQIIPSGYASQYQIRTVLGGTDQARGLDMLAVGDLLMDGARRNLGLGEAELKDFLLRVAARKFEAGARYPAGSQAGRPFKRIAPRTPWFDATDIAAPCCGAAATIITSDEELAERVASARSPRYRAAPVTEVLGVGEGTSNENLLHRQSPLLFATAVREALAATADDARLPLATFASSAFGVAHDAFPSIELSFLLGMGLSWERASERMAEGWSNPFGGLLSFGHALGASGLVQVSKAHHLFTGDQRYLKDPSPRVGFREDGALAFTSSVGGPLSHIVAGLFRGGFEQLRPNVQRSLARPERAEEGELANEWRARRHQLRLALPSHLATLPPGAWLVEGTTYVSLRSALRALSPRDVDALTFDGLEKLVLPEQLHTVRAELRAVMHVVLGEAERVASMFSVFRLLSDEVRELAVRWRAAGLLSKRGAGMPDATLAERVKELLRVPLAIVVQPGDDPVQRRRVVFLPIAGLGYDDLAGVDLLLAAPDGTVTPLRASPELLPFWNARATRPAEPSAPQRPGFATGLVDLILERGVRTASDLDLLRAWFAAGTPPARLEQALRASGSLLALAPAPVQVIFIRAAVASGGRFASEPAAAQELLGLAVREARAFLEAYQITVSQAGDGLEVLAWERVPFRSGREDGLVSAARFAREVAQATSEDGLVLRAAVCAGDGELFLDAAGLHAVASPASARAVELLGESARRCPEGAFIAFEELPEGLRERVGQRVRGFSASTGSSLFRRDG